VNDFTYPLDEFRRPLEPTADTFRGIIELDEGWVVDETTYPSRFRTIGPTKVFRTFLEAAIHRAVIIDAYQLYGAKSDLKWFKYAFCGAE
jgi:hypothetical protein